MRLLIAITTILMFGLLPTGLNPLVAHAQNISLHHVAPASSILPVEGAPLVLQVSLQGDKRIDLDMIAFVSVDGRSMEVPMSGTLDQNDQPIYTLHLRTPEAQLNYMFILFKEDGSIVTTPPYQLRRQCLPDTKLSTVDFGRDLPTNERAAYLIGKADSLEQDITAYGWVMDELEKLQELQQAKK